MTILLATMRDINLRNTVTHFTFTIPNIRVLSPHWPTCLSTFSLSLSLSLFLFIYRDMFIRFLIFFCTCFISIKQYVSLLMRTYYVARVQIFSRFFVMSRKKSLVSLVTTTHVFVSTHTQMIYSTLK